MKELHSFMGKINFVRKFISAYAEIVKPLMAMMTKDAKVKWTNEAKKAFHDIKEAIVKAPILTSLDYRKPFYLYSFASDHSVAGVLTQKDDEDKEKPIAFMSAPLKDAALNYSLLDKQAYALVRAVKKFCHYILRSQIIAIVLDLTIKNLLTQQELGCNEGIGSPHCKNST